MSTTETLVFTYFVRPFGDRVLVVDTQANTITVIPILNKSSLSGIYFGRCAGAVCLRSIFVSVFRFRLAWFPFTEAGSVGFLL